MSNAVVRSCAEKFIHEFNNDYLQLYGVHTDAVVTQGLGLDDVHLEIRLYATISTLHGPRVVSIEDVPFLDLYTVNYLEWVMVYLKLSETDATTRLRHCGLLNDT